MKRVKRNCKPLVPCKYSKYQSSFSMYHENGNEIPYSLETCLNSDQDGNDYWNNWNNEGKVATICELFLF